LGSLLEDPRNIPLPTYNRALKLAKKYEMNDVKQAILEVVLKRDEDPDPVDLTRSFERFTFAVDHPDLVPSNFFIKPFCDICRAEAQPRFSHIDMLKSHPNSILQIMNGRVWVQTKMVGDRRYKEWATLSRVWGELEKVAFH
jgi:hypothetical protein